MPLDEVDGTRPVSDVAWNPATKLFEVSVFRRRGPPLVVRDLSLGAAGRLRAAVRDSVPDASGITTRKGKERRVRHFPTKILLATDGSEDAGLALRAAVDLCAQAGSDR